MSGQKYSEFQLQKEREDRLKLVQDIQNLSSESKVLINRLREMLLNASAGIKNTFKDDVDKANKIISKHLQLSNSEINLDSNAGNLRHSQNSLQQAVNELRKTHLDLKVAFTEQANEIGQKLSKYLAKLEGKIMTHEQLIHNWWGEPQISTWQAELDNANKLLSSQEYSIAQPLMEKINQEVDDQVSFAAIQEDKHQKRLYLLKALRQVCAEMGFREETNPTYEIEGKRGSNILLLVDTRNRGRIQFTLSLEKINSFSEIADERCFEEFDKLSQFLQEGFGIHTHFQSPGQRPPSQDRHGGEVRLPENNSFNKSASSNL